MRRQGGGSGNRLSDWRRVTGAAAASGLAASAEEGGAAEEREGDGFGSGEDDFVVNAPVGSAGGARWAERRAAAGGSNSGGRGGRRKGGGGGGGGSRATRRAGGCVTLRGETETGGGHYASRATSRFGANNDGTPAARGSLSEWALKSATCESYQNQEQGQSEINVLRDMFGGGAVSDAEISHVYYHECRGSLEASIEALLRLANRADSTGCDSIGSERTERQRSGVSLDPQPASPSSSFAFPSASPSAFPSDFASASAITAPVAPPLVCPSTSSSPPLPPLAVPPSSFSAHPSSAHPYPPPSSPALASPPGSAPLLVALPCDLQDLILSALDLPSLARLACASRHLRQLIRLRRLALKHLALPRTLPAWAAPLLVGAHGGLESLSLQRLGRCEMDFRAVFAAAAGVGEEGKGGRRLGEGEAAGAGGGDFGREGGAMGKQRQVQQQQVVVGGVVMQPSRSLHSISLAGCVHLSDADVASLCALHRLLASVDLSSCRQVTDVALTWLGQHEREAGVEEERDGMTVKGEEQDRVATEEATAVTVAAAAGDSAGTASAARDQQGRRQTVTSQHLSAALSAALSSCTLTYSSSTTSSSSSIPLPSHSFHSPRGLTSINISDCPLITNRGLQTLLRSPPIASSLVSLDISCCCLVSSPGLNLPHSLSALRHLSASHLPLLESLTLLLPHSCPLEEISFSCCPVLQKLTIHSRSLRSLNLAGCRKLSSLSLICPALSSLILSQCSSLETFSPADRCPSLASLNAFLCRSLPASTLTTLLTHAKDLEELNCGGCALLESVRLPPVTHARLRRVLLEGCPVLSSVVVPAASLLLLDCRGCTQLREVRVLEHPAVAAEAAAAETSAAASAAAAAAGVAATASASSALPTAAAGGCSLGRVLLTNCSSLHTLVLPFSSIRHSILAAAACSKSHTTTTTTTAVAMSSSSTTRSTGSSSFGGTNSGVRASGGQEGAWRDVGSGSGVCSGDGGLARASGGRGGERGAAGAVFEASVSGCTSLPRETQRVLKSLCKLARAAA